MYDVKNMKIWKEEPENRNAQAEFEKVEITELNLSVRAFHCLKRAGCDTVGDVLRLINEEEGGGLRKIRNLGSRSEAEIIENVEKLRQEYAAKPVSQNTEKVRVMVRPAKRVWDRNIADFRISNYAKNRLRSCGVVKVQDLYATDPKNEPGWYAVRELFGEIAKEI